MDINFFTTIPGILIVCGVILLVIALIIFVVSSSKNKKPKKEESQVKNDSNTSNSINPSLATSDVNVGTDTVNVVSSGVSDNGSNVTPIDTNSVNQVGNLPVPPVVDSNVNMNIPIISASNPALDSPEVPSVAATEVDTGTISPVSIEPVVEPVINQAPEVVPVVPSPVIDDVIPAVQPVENINTVDTISTDVIAPVQSVNDNLSDTSNLGNNQVSVYGGVNPTDSIKTVEEVKPVIYGGNDPLEATQKIPVVEESHIPYGGNVTPIPPVEIPSVVSQVPDASIPEVVSIPDIQPIPTVNPVEVNNGVEEAEEL